MLEAHPDDIRQYLNHKMTKDAILRQEAMNDELREHITTTIMARSQKMSVQFPIILSPIYMHVYWFRRVP